MARYILKRLASGALTLFLFVTMLFFVVNILMPGDFMTQFRLGMGPEQRAEMAARLGIDRSLWQQYWDWISGLAVGNLGTSYYGASVARIVGWSLSTSLVLFCAGLLIAFPLGNWLGRAGAWRRRGPVRGLSTFVAIGCFTAFPPSLAFILEKALRGVTSPSTFGRLTTLDKSAWASDSAPGLPTPWSFMWGMLAVLAGVLVVVLVCDHLLRRRRSRGLPPLLVVGLLLGGPWLTWVLLGWRSQVVDLLGTLLLVVVGVVVLFYGEIQLVTEAAMEDAVDADFVTTARAKGLPERQVRDRHAARAALLPVLSRLVVSIPYFLAGLAILESVFRVPGGLGNLIFGAIRNQDTAVVVGALVVVGAVSLLARLALDVLHAVLDPRIRYGGGKLEVTVG